MRRDTKGDLIATVLDEHGGFDDRRLSPDGAEAVEQAWERNRFDLERYARFPIEFSAPDGIPVELPDAA